MQARARIANPYAFEAAIAPHIAAELAGIEIDLETIASAHEELSRLADIVVVEGAGGFLVPLNATQTGADLAARLGLPIVLVVGMRLGCLNHALLTRRQIEASGLRCAGWVANCILPDMPHLDHNIRALEQRLACLLLGVVPFLRELTPAGVAGLLSFDALIESAADDELLSWTPPWLLAREKRLGETNGAVIALTGDADSQVGTDTYDLPVHRLGGREVWHELVTTVSNERHEHSGRSAKSLYLD